MNEKEDLICRLLRSTEREGMERVIEQLHEVGFFEAPASAGHHLNSAGGLAIHSYNVCQTAMRLREVMIALKPEVEPRLQRNSIIIAALLHDVCKSDIYRLNDKKFRKDAKGFWENYTGYDIVYDKLPVGHGEKSVIMLLRWGLELSEDEILAIRWHMHAWDLPFQS